MTFKINENFPRVFLEDLSLRVFEEDNGVEYTHRVSRLLVEDKETNIIVNEVSSNHSMVSDYKAVIMNKTEVVAQCDSIAKMIQEIFSLGKKYQVPRKNENLTEENTKNFN